MFRCGWVWNCWNLFSNLHQSTRLLQMRLRRRLPKGPLNGKSISCFFRVVYPYLFLMDPGPGNRAMQGARGATESDICSQDRHAQARPGQVEFWKLNLVNFALDWIGKLSFKKIFWIGLVWQVEHGANSEHKHPIVVRPRLRLQKRNTLLVRPNFNFNWVEMTNFQVGCDGGEDLLDISCWRAEVCSCHQRPPSTMTLSTMTLSIVTLSTMTLSTMTPISSPWCPGQLWSRRGWSLQMASQLTGYCRLIPHHLDLPIDKWHHMPSSIYDCHWDNFDCHHTTKVHFHLYWTDTGTNTISVSDYQVQIWTTIDDVKTILSQVMRNQMDPNHGDADGDVDESKLKRWWWIPAWQCSSSGWTTGYLGVRQPRGTKGDYASPWKRVGRCFF